MFTAIQPFEFTAKASLDGGVLRFKTTKALLRFKPVPGHPEFKLSRNGVVESPWKIDEASPTPTTRLIGLTLDGPAFNGLIARDPDQPLYQAFLDRLQYELPMNLGPFPLGQTEGACEVPTLLYTLFLKLNVVVW